ncbi:hypothetical protein V1504DRAFT_479900 [Lipomyces starkeyi]
MAYIIAVNASIASDSGGTCTISLVLKARESFLIQLRSPCPGNYSIDVKRDLVTATAAIAALTTFCMVSLPTCRLALLRVVGYHGSGSVSFPLAVTAVFVEGWIFIGLSILGIRQWLARAIPTSIKLATGAGIGLYLTIIGLYGSAGLGVITGATATPVDLSGCDTQYAGDAELCSHHKMTSKTMWLGIFCGGFVTALLMLYRVKGAIIAGIALVSIISWPRTTDVTYFPYNEAGQSRFDFFKNVVAFHKIETILTAQEWNVSSIPGGSGQFWLALVTFLYVDILDTTGTLYSMAKFAGLMDKRTGDFEGSVTAYIVDAGGTVIGSLFGTPPVTAYIERQDWYHGHGHFYLLLHLALLRPHLRLHSPWATGSTLIIVGSMMMTSVAEINWSYFGDAIPAFLTIALMPFTYSIAYGLIAGIITFMILNTLAYVDKLTNGRIVPDNYHKRAGWSWRMAMVDDGDDLPDPATEPKGVKGVAMVFLPPWMVRLVVHRKRRFWQADEAEGAKVIEANTVDQAAADNGGTLLEVQSEASAESSKEKQIN